MNVSNGLVWWLIGYGCDSDSTSTIAWIRALRAACKIVVVLDAARADGNGTDMAHGHTRKLLDREVLEDLGRPRSFGEILKEFVREKYCSE